jgi:zinc protease
MTSTIRTRIAAGVAAGTTVAALLGSSAAPLSAQYPSEPPPAGPVEPLPFPEVQEAELPNGVRLLLIESHALPVVSLRLSMRAGQRDDPLGREGLAAMTSELLTKGTASRTAEEIAEAIESVGGSLSAGAGADFFQAFSTVLSDDVELAFDLMSDVLLRATFPEDELELVRTQALSVLQLQKSDPGALASQAFMRGLYGDHPYGRRQTEESAKAITRDDVRNWAATHLRPQGALLTIAGDLTLDQATSLANRYFGEWSGAAPHVEYAPPPTEGPTEIVLVHRPGSAQSNIIVGNRATRPIEDGTYYAADVANKILGGGTDARLFLILREERGWTYGAYSGLPTRLDGGYFRATAEVRTPVTDSALVEMMHQIRRMQTEAVPDSTMAAAKGYLVGSYPLSIETPQQIASRVANAVLFGRGIDFVRTYGQQVDAVSASEVVNAAQRVFKPDSAVVIVVGDGQEVYDVLSAIAPVRIIDIEGEPLAVEDLTPKATALVLDPVHIVARRDSFQIVAQGNPIGAQVTETVLEGGELTVRETTNIAMVGMQQESETVLSIDPVVMRSVDQTMTFRGQTGETHLAFADGRITGTATTPQPTGQLESKDVDAALLEGVVDQNVMAVVVPALALTEGAAFTLNAFDASEGTTTPLSVDVAGVEEVTVPAGTFSAFRVEITGGQQPVTVFVSQETPRRVVKIVPTGQPIAMELVQ